MPTHYDKKYDCWINDKDRGGKNFSDEMYLDLDRWWEVKRRAHEKDPKQEYPPSRRTFMKACEQKNIGGTVDGHSTTFPYEKSMRGIYARLLNGTNEGVRKVLGPMGHCAPIYVYIRRGVPYRGTTPNSVGEQNKQQLIKWVEAQKDKKATDNIGTK